MAITTLLHIPAAGMEGVPAALLASNSGASGPNSAVFGIMAEDPADSGEIVLAAATGVYAQAQDDGYQTSCRCAPDSQEFCQGTLGDTDIFLSIDGTLLNGADSSTCRPMWEYEFSEPIDKLAIDTTSKLIFFSSGDTVYALSLTEKELVFTEKMPGSIKNISLQPKDKLSVDLTNGERHYVSVSMLNSEEIALTDTEPTHQATQDSVSPAADQITEIDTQAVVNAPPKQKDTAIFRLPNEQNSEQTTETPTQEPVVEPINSMEQDVEVHYDSIAVVTFEEPEKALNIEYESVAQVTFAKPVEENITDKPEVKHPDTDITTDILASNTKDTTPQTKPLTRPETAVVSNIENQGKKAWNCLTSVALKPGRYSNNKNIYINGHGVTMISMDYLIASGLCIKSKISPNKITISGPNGETIIVDNLKKTMQVGNNKPVKFSKSAKSYRTADLKYYIPLREVLASAGYGIHWSAQDRTINISAN